MSLAMFLAMAPPAEGGQGNVFTMFAPMILIFGIFYFMLIRPQQRKEKERLALINNIQSGERILFSGGILGTVTNVKEHTLIVKVAENVKLEIARGAVSRIVEKGDKIGEDTPA